ncbi:MAG: HK97 family phage prohead protease [Kofleriaceae bacterium]
MNEEQARQARRQKSARIADMYALSFHIREATTAEQASATENRRRRFVASTSAIDRYGEIVEQKWRLEHYLKNPVVLWCHDSDDMPVGRATVVEVVQGPRGPQLEIEVEFATADMNPQAEQCWKMVKGGFINAVSVGFFPHDIRRELREGEDVWILSDNELLELSVCPIPANPEALAKAKAAFLAKSAPQPTTPYRTAPTPSTNETNTTMDIETLKKDLERAQAEAKAAQKAREDAEKALADERARSAKLAADLEMESAKRSTAEGRCADMEKTLTGAVARAEKAEDEIVERSLEDLVSKYITPAEKVGLVKMAKAARRLQLAEGEENPFDEYMRSIKSRPEMSVTQAASVLPAATPAAPTPPTERQQPGPASKGSPEPHEGGNSALDFLARNAETPAGAPTNEGGVAIALSR